MSAAGGVEGLGPRLRAQPAAPAPAAGGPPALAASVSFEAALAQARVRAARLEETSRSAGAGPRALARSLEEAVCSFAAYESVAARLLDGLTGAPPGDGVRDA